MEKCPDCGTETDTVCGECHRCKECCVCKSDNVDKEQAF